MCMVEWDKLMLVKDKLLNTFFAAQLICSIITLQGQSY